MKMLQTATLFVWKFKCFRTDDLPSFCPEPTLPLSYGILLETSAMLKGILLLVLLSLPLSASATSYYVDNCVRVGNDSNNGTSPSTPWLTVSKVNGSTLLPGDSVLFQKTCTWRGQLRPPSSGSPGNPITFGAYGSGKLPIINGSVVVAGWSVFSGSIYQASLASSPNDVFQDGTNSLSPALTIREMVPGTFYCSSGTIYVWTTASDSPASHTIEASIYPVNFFGLLYTYDKTYIVYDSLHITKSNWYGVEIDGAGSHITVQNSNFDYGYQNDISPAETSVTYDSIDILNNMFANGGIGRTRAVGPGSASEGVAINGFGLTNSMISGNLVLNTTQGAGCTYTAEGIQAGAGSNNLIIINNLVYNTCIGIYIGAGYGTGADTKNVAVKFNYVHNSLTHNYQIALEGANASVDGVVFQGNVSDTAGNCGLLFGFNATGGYLKNILVYNNTFVNSPCGISIYGPTSDASNQFENNIISVSSGSNYAWIQNDENADNYSPDFNLFYSSSSATIIYWLGETYTMRAFQAAESKMLHSICADPQLNNSPNGNYSLLSSSPAIGAGTNLGVSYELGLDPLTTFPWGTVNQDSYGPTWSIGAFVYVPQNRPAPPASISISVN